MGYYIQTGQASNKAADIIRLHGAEVIHPKSDEFNQQRLCGKAIICVINNGPFDAAAFVYTPQEFLYFLEEMSNRQKTWLATDWNKACELTGLLELKT